MCVCEKDYLQKPSDISRFLCIYGERERERVGSISMQISTHARIRPDTNFTICIRRERKTTS